MAQAKKATKAQPKTKKTHEKVQPQTVVKTSSEHVEPEKDAAPKVSPEAVVAKKAAAKTGKVKPTVVKRSVVGSGVGRRKSAIARVRLVRAGTGIINVNGLAYDAYFDTEEMRLDASQPLRLIPQAQQYDVFVNVHGGGKSGQAGAVKVGIARSLLMVDDTLRPQLRAHGLVTVDSRVKERKKPGQKAARRKFQFVKR